MNIVEGKLYFLRNLFFEKYKRKYNLLENEKVTKTKRPSYFCIKDDLNNEILWFIPLSKQYDKYMKIYLQKLKKNKRTGKNYPINNFVFCDNIAGARGVFLIQNLFPIEKRYIEKEYTRNNQPIRILDYKKSEILNKVKKVLISAKRNRDYTTFTSPLKFKQDIEHDLENEKSIINFFSNPKSNINKDLIIKIFLDCISIEEIKDYINIINTINPIMTKNISDAIIGLEIDDAKKQIEKLLISKK